MQTVSITSPFTGVQQQAKNAESTALTLKEKAFEAYMETYTGKHFKKAAAQDGEPGLSLKEFIAWEKHTKEKLGLEDTHGYSAAKRFHMADKDKDGIVSGDEAKAQKQLEIKYREYVWQQLKQHA